VNALAQGEVGDYLNRHFVSAFQKVGNFQMQWGQKDGGNVAGYFCMPDGRVLHIVVGPVDAYTFLREARWAQETFELAQLEELTPGQLQLFFRRAHLERLYREQHVTVPEDRLPVPGTATRPMLNRLLAQNKDLNLGEQGQVHLLLAVAPLPRLNQAYRVVFERILNEKVSTSPVATP
jgi:hypothetical protein